MATPWNLFLDDVRSPTGLLKARSVVARSTEEAKALVLEKGMPQFMSLDHDLGGEDTSMVFLKWLSNEFWNGADPVPEYYIHSANPVGSLNIKSYMESWHRSTTM